MITKENKINFIGIGAAKCATTWVYRCLLEHPEICGPYEKELNFFSTKDHPLFKNSEDNKKILYKDGINSYLNYFSNCPENSIKGEFSTSYISDPGAARNIKKNFPDIKIIAILRDPVKRAHSFFWFAKDFMMKEKNKTFEEALKNNPEIYINWGMYCKQLKPYFDLFPQKNIGVFFVDDLKKDPERFMRSIYNFLEVDNSFVAPSTFIKENQASKVRFEFARKLIDSVVAFAYKMRLEKVIGFLRKLGFQKFIHYFHYKLNVQKTSKPKIKSSTERRLRRKFIKDIEELEKLTGKDLANWKK